MTRLIVALSLLGFATAAFGETIECRDPLEGENSPFLVVATVNSDRESGTIEVARVKYETAYWVDGFDRTWAWDYVDEVPQFLLVIQPDGAGQYYAYYFILPDQRFQCRQSEIEAEGSQEKKPETRKTEPEAKRIGSPTGMNIDEGDYLPIVSVPPVYPARALSRGLEGYVDLSFTVTTTGTVRDPVVIQSTSSLFDRAAIRAVLKFRYKPRVVDGVPIDIPDVKTRITFKIED